MHLRFRQAWKAQGNRDEDLPFRALFYPYGTFFIIFINVFIVIIAGYSNFISGFDAIGKCSKQKAFHTYDDPR